MIKTMTECVMATYGKVRVGGHSRVGCANVGPLKEEHSLIKAVDSVNGNGS